MNGSSIGILQINLTTLRYHGLWPKYLDGRKDRYYRLKLVLVVSALFLLWYGSTSHLINMIVAKKQNVSTEIFEDIGISFTATSMLFVFFVFLLKRRDITCLIQELEDYDTFGKPEDIENVNNKYNFYSKLYYLYCSVGASLFFVLNQTIGAHQCRAKNVEFNRDIVCGFYMHIWLPFNYNFTPAYEIVTALTLFVGVYAGPVFTVFLLVFIILQHLICKIRHLKQMAESIFEEQNLNIQKERLITCIRYHQHIIRLCDKFNYCFGEISFLYITVGSIILSITLYQCLREVSLASLMHMGVWLVNITFACMAGQQLIDESESVAFTFYDLQWTDASNDIKLMIKFIIMRSQKALSIKTLSFGELSLATYMAIIKSAYQYLALMRNTVND